MGKCYTLLTFFFFMHDWQAPKYNYRSAVRKLIPQLEFLDDAPAEEEEHRCSSTTMDDWSLLKESIKDIPLEADPVNDCIELLGDLIKSDFPFVYRIIKTL